MEEFIVNNYWLKDSPTQYREIRDRFTPHISEGTINNYLNELIAEKKIHKIYQGKSVYYAPPKMSVSVKFISGMTAFVGFFTFMVYILYGELSQLLIGFLIGTLFVGFIWNSFEGKTTKNENSLLKKAKKRIKRK